MNDLNGAAPKRGRTKEKTKKENMSTLEKRNAELASDKIEIRRFRSRKLFVGSNYRVVLKGREGDETVGHYRFLADAVGAAKDTAADRNK